MDVNQPVVGKDVEQVLAVRLGPQQHLPVDEVRSDEPALRAADRQRHAGEQLTLVEGEPADRMSLGHRPSQPRVPPRVRRRGAPAGCGRGCA